MIKNINIDNIKDHPFIAAIIVIQIAFLLVMFTKACITPQHNISVNMDSFSVDRKNAYMANGGVNFRPGEGIGNDNKLNVTAKELRVPTGAYRVDIAYDSEVNENKFSENNAIITMSSGGHIGFDTLILDDQNNAVSGKLWAPFSNCNDLKINIAYNGKGTLTVNKITFTEEMPYRFIKVLGVSLIFLLIDLGILIFYTGVAVPIKGRHVILLLIVITASLPFLSKMLFFGHDIYCHVLRIASVAEELGHGQFPVRMEAELNNGYGYPWSIYYCDIFLYPAAILYRLSVPLAVCYQIYVVMVNTATTAFTYRAVGKFTKRPSVKLLATGLYVLCVYRLVNVNVRAAMGEYTAMAFLPLVIAGLYLIYTKAKPEFKDWLYLTLGMSGVIMCHVLTGEMIVLNAVLMGIVLWKKTLTKEVLTSLLKAAGLTLGITAWFWVPFLDYYMHHVTVVQKGDLRLLAKTTVDPIYLFQLFAPGKAAGNYLGIGLPLVVVSGFVLFCLMKYRKNKTSKANMLRLISGLAFLNILLVCSFFPWGMIQNRLGIDGIGYQVGTIQFAWRFLSIASVLLVFALVITMNLLTDNNRRFWRMISFALVGCIVITVGFFYYRYTDEVKTLTYNIMQPYSRSDELYLLNGTDQSIQNKAQPEVISGNMVLKYYYRDHDIFKMNVDNKGETAAVAVPIYNYRYFNAYDEKGTLLDKTSTDSKCFAIQIPAAYSGEITVKFEAPYLWRIAEIISLLCIIFVLWRCRHSYKKPIGPMCGVR